MPMAEGFLPRAAISQYQLEQLRALLRAIAPSNRFYTRKLAEAQVLSDIGSLAEFSARFPFTTKQEIMEDQRTIPPFGSNLTFPLENYTRYHQTSGTSGVPIRWLDNPQSWEWMVGNWGQIFDAAGVVRSDRIFFAFSFGPFIGFWSAHDALAQRGAMVIPAGGMSTESRLELARTCGATVVLCTPTYALHLAQVAADEGLDPRDFKLKIMFFSGEPGASIPGVRDKIEALYGAKVIDCGSMAEMSPWMNVAGSAQTSGLLCWQDVVYTEICDPKTMLRVPYGKRGTPVYTHLERNSQPMIRLVSGDLSLWTNEPNPCGRTYPRLPQGIFGRIDDMFTIRGENVYPSEIDAALNELPHYGGEHRIVISREAAMDELLLQVEADAATFAKGGDAVARFRGDVEHKVQKVLGLRTLVEIAEPNSIPRTDFKARRVIDDRAVFRDMHRQIEGAQG